MSTNGEEEEPTSKVRAKRRRMRSEDWQLISRVLVYAHPFRAKIAAALMVGMFAGMLTALNLAMLIPVLTVLLDSTEYQKELVRLEDRRDRSRAELRDDEDKLNLIDKAELWWRIKWTETRIDWSKWVIKRREKVIYWMAGALVVAALVRSLMEFWSKYQLQKCFFMAIVRLKSTLYDRCLRMDMGEFDRRTSADLIARLNNDVRAVRMVFTTMVGEAVLAPFSVIFLLVLLLYLSPKLTLMVAIGLPFTILPITLIGKWLRTQGKKDEEEDAKLLGYTQEIIQGLLIVKTYGAERRESKRFHQLSREMAHRQIRREQFRLLSEPFVEVTASIAMGVVLVIGAYIVIDNNEMSPAEFLIFLAALTRFYPPIKKVSGAYVKLQKSLASAERIFEVVDSRPELHEKPDAAPLAPFSSEIEFRDVSFSYTPTKPPVLRDFNITIPAGQKIAFVGKTGAGKSTIARLLARLYDPNQGAVLIDGVDAREVTLKSLRRQIAAVTQDIILFNGTVRENIAYSRPDATEQEIIEAAKAANAHEFVDQLPLGYDTPVGERGGQLSGGQKQRLSIARALLANAPILILDEATSALDNESEAAVQQAIERLMENRTVVMIAHRLSTVRKADEIVVLRDGGIAERGNHDQLVAQRGYYYNLVADAELT